MRLPAVVLLVATLLFWGLYDRFESAGPVLLDAPSLSGASRIRGDCQEKDGHFVLSVPTPEKTARLNIRVSGATEYERLRISGRIKVNGVREGKYRWSCARLLLAQYDAKENWLRGHHTLKAERGTHDWEMHDNIFDLLPEMEHVDVVMQQIGLSGTAEFDQLIVEPVRLKASFHWWRALFSVLWLGMAVLFFRRCRLDRRKLRILILLNALAILAGALMPEEWIEGVTDGLKGKASVSVSNEGTKQPKNKQPALIRELRSIDLFNDTVGTVHQAGHFLLFASLCFLTYICALLERKHRAYFFKVAFDLLLFSCITESLQFLTMDRKPGVTDWLTDIYGMLAAFTLFLIVLGARRIFAVSKS